MSHRSEVVGRHSARKGKVGRGACLAAALLGCLMWGFPAAAQTPLGTAFTYQGRLTDAGLPANGNYDLQFTLFTAASAGSQVGSPLIRTNVAVSGGLFTVSLDFGAVFAGNRGFLEIGVRPGGSAVAFTPLSARQELTPSPNAVFAATAASSTSATSATTVAGLSCTTNQVLKWSGTVWTCGADTDTTYSAGAGGGLALTGNQFGLLASCVGGQVLKWNGTAWACAADASSGGTVTSVGSGSGLTGGPITGTGSLSIAPGGVATGMIANSAVGAAQITAGAVGLTQINPAQVQARVAGTCAAGSSIRVVNADGTVTCQADTNSGGTVTSVTAGAGLAGGLINTSGTISVATGGVTSTMIGSGQVVKGLNGLADTVTIAGSGGATVSTAGSTITVAAASPLPSGAVVLGLSGDTTLIGAGYSELNVRGQEFWTPTTTVGVPSGRFVHTAVWTGSKMIVWGGNDPTGFANTGSHYDPVVNTWTAIATTSGVLSGRYRHTAVWTGSKMIVWGGVDGTPYANTGGQYDPMGDTWTATATTPGVPSGRYGHSAVWTGSKMIVWGGYDGAFSNTGGQYDPAGNTWTATTMTGVPTARFAHTAVWTGSKVIVWGGFDVSPANTGSRYDPAGDTWTAVTTTGAPSGRYEHTAVWTGSKMIVWGGVDGTPYANTGGQYDPAAGGPGGSWTTTATTAGVPSGRHSHTAVWTGSRMIVWGGDAGTFSVETFENNGGRYDPMANSWLSTEMTGTPSGRLEHTAVWTGSRMIVWGGRDGSVVYLNTGAQWLALSYFMKN